MPKTSYCVVNILTFYRLLITPVLVLLIFTKQEKVFAWMLPVSFFTDLVDGFLARKFGVASVLGAKLDSIADDLTILSAITAALVFKFPFIKENILVFAVLFGLYLIQTVYALIKYHKISSFHTYAAKAAAVFQGTFLILLFLLDNPPYFLFYIAALFTFIDLIEEIILVHMLPGWKANVKGIYWLRKNKSGKSD
jgi:phosphatidylglycerophosphate synthase